MTDPTDRELLEFVARFAGWTSEFKLKVGEFANHAKYGTEQIPDYLHSVDAWLRDVWPKINVNKSFPSLWQACLADVLDIDKLTPQINADARSRCLALWRTLEGKLP